MGRLSAFREFRRRLGTASAIRWYALGGLGRRKWLPPRVRATAKGLRHRVTLRSPPSSDFDVFHQVLIADEYSFLSGLRDVRFAVDLGANIGLASAVVLSRFPEAIVLCVEPDPENLRILERNLRPYGDRVEIVSGAVWSSSGEVSLAHDRGDGREWATAVTAGIGVRAYTLWELLANRGPVDLLKIDIEGSERQLFSGDVSWLSRVRNLCIELHGADCERAFRSATVGYRWTELICGEYTVCEGVERCA